MINKTVKVQDVNLLKFFYPSFYIKSELSYSDKDRNVIYVGPVRKQLKNYLETLFKEYISTAGPVDIDLT